MLWRDINNTHHGARVSISATSTPDRPIGGEGPYVGTVICKKENHVPILQDGDVVRSFAWWWSVEFIDDMPKAH